jgi:hypothetical protein
MTSLILLLLSIQVKGYVSYPRGTELIDNLENEEISENDTKKAIANIPRKPSHQIESYSHILKNHPHQLENHPHQVDSAALAIRGWFFVFPFDTIKDDRKFKFDSNREYFYKKVNNV